MATEDRVRALAGVSVVGYGRLEAEEFGHKVGTDYVLIQADCVDEAWMAREELSSVARIPEDAWHGSWTPRRVNGRYVLERKIFPTIDQISA
jgi:hypothetical protein